MTATQWRYYALNQFLLGRPFSDLPSDAQEVVGDYKDVWEHILESTKLLKLSELERLFVNLLRVPFYGMCVTKDSRVLLMEQLVSTVRNTDLDMHQCTQWPPAIIAGVSPTDFGSPAVKDGVLYIPKTMLEEEVDLDSALTTAFYLRCWGDVNPSDDLKTLVKTLVSYASPQEDITLSAKSLSMVFDLFEKTKVHPLTLVSTALIVCDLAPAYKQLHGLCWWKNFEHGRIYALVPRGKTERLACCSFTGEEFLKLVTNDQYALSKVCVRGNKIQLEGVDA